MQESQPSPGVQRPGVESRRELILALGAVSFFVIPCALLVFLSHELFALMLLALFLAPVLGGSAWLMANKDLKGIRNGLIPVSAVRGTKMGRTLAILGTFTAPVLVVAVSHFSTSGILDIRESMESGLNNLAANAHEYRVLPASKHGGEGAYTGYEIPSEMSSDGRGFYSAKVLHADTIQFQAVWRDDSRTTISIRIGPDGRPIEGSRIFTGNFE